MSYYSVLPSPYILKLPVTWIDLSINWLTNERMHAVHRTTKVGQTELNENKTQINKKIYNKHNISMDYWTQSVKPCETINFIDNWKRSAANDKIDNTFLCDWMLEEGWYRIYSTAGDRMPTECLIGGYRCGTAYPIYLSRKGVPTGEDIFPAKGEIVNRTAYEVYDYLCANAEYPIRIKNCTSYLVYYLRPTIGCNTAYCFGTELPCPIGQSSKTGFSPGCSEVYPTITLTSTIAVDMHVAIVLRNSERYIDKSPKFLCGAIEAKEEYAFDIKFYINNFIITGAQYINVSFSDIGNAVLLQEHWEGKFKPNMIVKCSVQARYKDRGVPGVKFFSEDYFAGIK
ncbi:hypothetical protein AM593_08702, partial [Mytilus galloprovincialis]